MAAASDRIRPKMPLLDVLSLTRSAVLRVDHAPLTAWPSASLTTTKHSLVRHRERRNDESRSLEDGAGGSPPPDVSICSGGVPECCMLLSNSPREVRMGSGISNISVKVQWSAPVEVFLLNFFAALLICSGV